MSGRLVGEVIALSEQLRERGLSQRAFYALIAIAEKAHTETRQGSVRWDHIRAALYGASKRTAERAIRELTKAGIVVAKPGYKNAHGSRAPTYTIQQLADTDTQMSESTGSDTDTQVSESTGSDTDKARVGYRQHAHGYRHPGDLLDGSIDGSFDEREARARDNQTPNVPAVPDYSSSLCSNSEQISNSDPEPRPYCRTHMPWGTSDPCGACLTARKNHERWQHRQPDHALAPIFPDPLENQPDPRQAIHDCPLCDEFGWQIGSDGAVTDPAAKCDHTLHPRKGKTPREMSMPDKART
jgi:hypothetical protein